MSLIFISLKQNTSLLIEAQLKHGGNRTPELAAPTDGEVSVYCGRKDGRQTAGLRVTNPDSASVSRHKDYPLGYPRLSTTLARGSWENHTRERKGGLWGLQTPDNPFDPDAFGHQIVLPPEGQQAFLCPRKCHSHSAFQMPSKWPISAPHPSPQPALLHLSLLFTGLAAANTPAMVTVLWFSLRSRDKAQSSPQPAPPLPPF